MWYVNTTHICKNTRGWGDGSVSKVLSYKSKDLRLIPSTHVQAGHSRGGSCNPALEGRKGRRQVTPTGLVASLVELVSSRLRE